MSETPKFGGAANDKTPSGSSSAKSRVELVSVNLTVNSQPRTMTIEPRTTLLDALRENLALTGTKKACDRGECGACTVHIDGRRVLSCMTLAATALGRKLKMSVVPMPLVRVLGLFVPILREFPEMQFQWDRPYHVDWSKFAARFWSDPTPFEVGIPLTARSFVP